LSRKFYETIGEDVTNELLDWFKSVDQTYRNDLRELNELNFTRFDARFEQRLAEFDAKWGSQFATIDGRFIAIDGRFIAMDAKLEQRLAELKSDLIKWMFAFWVPTALGIIGTAVAVVALLVRR